MASGGHVTIFPLSTSRLGSKSSGFHVDYQVEDPDGDEVTVVERMDGVIKRSFTATPGANNTFAVTGEYFMKVLNGPHAMTITATDTGGKATVLPLSFTKEVYACLITLEEPMEADDLITKMVMNVVRSIPADAEFKVLVTNNASDDEPVWEDVTANVIAGLNYLFDNAEAPNGHAFNFIITASRREGGQGGHIGSIGGAFE